MSTSSSRVVYGRHAVQALLEHHPEKVVNIFCQKERHEHLDDLRDIIENQGYSVQPISKAKLTTLAGSEHHQGIAAMVRGSATLTEKEAIAMIKNMHETPLIVVLEGIQDPHNMGACLRSAEAMGVHVVFIAKDNTAPLNAVVSKAACGADHLLKIAIISNVARCLTLLQAEGVWIIGTSGDATQTLPETNLTRAVAIVMGAEGTGLKRLTLDKCDETVKIPMIGKTESLNVSVATGVCLYECQRQRARL